MDLASLPESRFYDKFKSFFLIFFATVLIARFVSFYWIFPHALDSIIFLGLSVYAMFFIFVDVFTKRNILKSQNLIWLLLFFCSCTISCIMYIHYGWKDNLKALMSIALNFFFLYPYMVANDKKNVRKIIVLLQKILIITWLVLAICSLITFFMQYSKIFYMHGTRILFGCIENRLFGTFTDPNYASVVSILTIIFSFAILGYNNQNKLIRGICIANIPIQFFYITLGSSRTGEVCLLLVAFISSFIFSYRLKPRGKIYFFFFRILSALFICLVIHFAIEYTRILFSYIPSFFEQNHYRGSGGGFVFHQAPIERPDVAESSDISNLRFRIWASAFDIFKTTWLFGASPRNALAYAKDILPNAFIVKRGYDAHNFYVATLIYTGICGVISLGTFLIKSAIRILKYYINKCFLVEDVMLNSMVISIICIAVSGMFLSEILFITTVGSFFFWLFLGCVVSVVSQKQRNV